MHCTHCGFENPDGMKFCGECGTALQHLCPQCGFENPPRFKFCGECGASLTAQMPTPSPAQEEQPTQAEPPPPEPHTPDAERRQLTILFTDLVDSTKLSGQLDAEDYREIVRAYQATCAEVIQRYDCHLAQTLGDGLLIYSGYPVAHDNDAERAVRTGLGILDAMKAFNERLEQEKDIRLAVRVGIHTGLVVVGDVGAGSKQEQLALGEVPNVAARIQGVAEPDTVVISAATYQLVEGYFTCEALGEQTLRGVADPMATYRVLGESGAQSRLDIVSARGRTPLVGRESEMTLLLERWAQVKDGSGQVVLLSGEPGIGKTKIAQTLKDYVADEPHTRLECRSSPYFTNSALYPIIDMVQRTLRFQADDTPETKLDKLEQNLSQYHLPTHETVPLFATLLSIPVPEDRYPSLDLSPQRQRQKTLVSIVAIILELAERQPLLFILDDSHWTDPTTLEFLDLLIDQTPTAQILALITYRPEFQPTWGNRSYLTPITLARLARNQVERMAEQVAGAKRLPDELVQQLVDKSDGVPLYVEEMTKAVLELGVLKESGGQYELTGPISSLAIPATLQDSLMARLDRLVTAKAVAQYAAVIGRQFSYELLQAVSQLDDPTLQREISRLVEAELVYQRGLPPNATYIFKHALIQETATQSLLRSQQKEVHQRIAHLLEERFPETVETQPELLAHHYTEAGRLEAAVAYWQRAGEHAHTHSAYREAIAHLRQGIALLTTFPETRERMQHELDLQLTLASAYHAMYGQAAPEVEQCHIRIRELGEHLGDDHCLFYAHMGLLRCYGGRGQRQEQNASLDALVQVAQRTQTPQLLVEAHMARGTVMMDRGQLALGRDHLAQAIAHYNPQDHPFYVAHSSLDPGVNSLSRYSWTLWFLGYPEQALAHSQQTLALAQDLGHVHSLAMVYNFAAILHLLRGDDQAVQEQAEAAMVLATQHDLHQWQQTAAILQGWYLAHHEHCEEHLVEFQQAVTTYRQRGLYLEWFLALLAQVYGLYGQYKIGLELLAEAFEIIKVKNEFFCRLPELHRLNGELLLSQSLDNAAEAESCFHQAIAIAQSQQAKSWELRAATSLSRLWQSQGKRDEARALLGDVYGWFTEGHDTADLKDAKALLDELK